jgi:hypothetical protein
MGDEAAMSYSDWIFGREIHDIRPYWVALVVLVVALCLLVGQAGAYSNTFQSWSTDNWVGGINVGTGEYLDLFHADIVSAGYNYWDVSYPTNYWAYTWVDGEPGTYFKFLKSDKTSASGDITLTGQTKYMRVEFKREDDLHIRIYKNGVLNQDVGVVNDVPYYFVILRPAASSGLDDMVFGTNEEHNIIGCPPQTWFVAKDIFDSGFTGLYDVVDHQVYASTMHVSYANDDGASTIVVAGVQNGNVVNTTIVNTYAGIVTYNLTTMLFNSGAPYGQYRIYMSDITGTAEDYFWYKAIATSGTSVQWDDTTYTNGDTATVTFSISESNWVTDDYAYRLEVWDEDLVQKKYWSVTTRPTNGTQTIDIDTTYFPESGTYYCVLNAIDLSSSEEILLVYDDAAVVMPGSGEVIVEGVTYDATTNLTLGSCTVSATQLGGTTTGSSDAVTGEYEITGLVTDWSLGMNASKTGYIGYLTSFTPYEGGTYGVDIPLVPSGGPGPGDSSNTTTAYYNSTTDGTAIGGICYEGPYWTLCDGCDVTVSNDTWSCSTQTGAGGWYQCNNIGCGGTYTLSCSKANYTTYSTPCSLTEGCFNREDATLEASNDLTVYCKELSTGAFITDTVTVTLSTGPSTTTSTGTATFTDLAYGYYEIEATAEGYYPGSSSAVMDGPKTATCYLQAQGEEGSPGLSYAPHAVRFTFRDTGSNPLDNLTVIAEPLECTGPWTWLVEWLGLNQTCVDIQHTTLNGTTGSDGSWTAWMIETVRYRLTATDAERGINTTWTLYPKQDEYSYIIDLEPVAPSYADNIAWNCSSIQVNSTHYYLHCDYSDTLNHTSSCVFQVANSSGSVVYTQSCSPANNCSINYTVSNTKGDAYTWGFTAEHTDFGEISSYRGITLPGTGGRLVDLGISDFWYDLICLAALTMCMMFFSGKMNPHGGIVTAFMGGILFWIGWLSVTPLIVGGAIVLAILIYIEKKEERTPV